MKMKKYVNLLEGWVAYNYNKITLNNFPLIFAIETTNKCNLSCPICPRRKMKRKIGIMEEWVFKKIIDEVKEYQVSVYLHNYGEPLLDPFLFERIKYCKLKGIKTKLSTNATLLSPTINRKILDSGLDLIILCLDRMTKEIYETIRKGAKFEEVKHNILSFLAFKRNNIPYTILQIINTKLTQKQLAKFKTEWKDKVDEISFKPFSTFGGKVDETQMFSSPSLRYRKTLPFRRPPCYYLWHSLVVLWDGDVVFCCRDFNGEEVIGNVKENSLKEMWNSDRMKELRISHIEGRFPKLCEHCIEYPPFTPTKFLVNWGNLVNLSKKIRQKWSV